MHAPAAASYVTLTDSSCMGGAVWTDNGDGTFTSAPENGYYGYSWLDLYLMGLAAPEEVPSWFHLVDTDPSQPLSYYPAPGETVTGTRRDFVVEHVIDAEGPRDPSHLESPSDFFVPMVLVVRPGEDPTAGAAQVAGLCEDWMGDFALATVGRGTVTCDRVDAVSHPPDSIIDQPAGATEVSTGTTVSFLGRGDDADGDGLTLSWDFDGQAAPVTGPGPHDITFTESGVFTVTLRSRDATGRVDPSPARVDVVVTCADLPEVTGLRLTKEGSALRFRWNDLPGRPDQYLIHAGVSPEAALTLEHEVTDGSGETGVVTTTPATTRYFVVRARNLPDCLGP
ncbi:MAG: PKD domain-containing protein [Acidobacteriota bacterium]